jgi:hypothetical protein
MRSEHQLFQVGGCRGQSIGDFGIVGPRRYAALAGIALCTQLATLGAPWNEWTIRILVAMEREASYGVPGSCTSVLFSNESERFLAVYDNQRRYVELFGENGGCFG